MTALLATPTISVQTDRRFDSDAPDMVSSRDAETARDSDLTHRQLLARRIRGIISWPMRRNVYSRILCFECKESLCAINPLPAQPSHRRPHPIAAPPYPSTVQLPGRTVLPLSSDKTATLRSGNITQTQETVSQDLGKIMLTGVIPAAVRPRRRSGDFEERRAGAQWYR
jgi:hypothetical protein